MKRTAIMSLALAAAIASAASAQTAPPGASLARPGPPPADPVTMTLSRATLQLIGQGVMELPYKTAAPVLNDLQSQINAIDRAAAERKPEKSPEAAATPGPLPEAPPAAPARPPEQ